MESRAAQRAHSKNWPVRDVIIIYNMRYKDSVEDRVHELLSNRLKSIHKMFGQLPDILRDVWIDVAQGRIESARQLIDSLPKKNRSIFVGTQRLKRCLGKLARQS
jgi:hypothetical protein